MELKARIPDGPSGQRWDKHRFEMKLVNPANKRKYTVLVVGTGLAGGAAAATLAELGYNVKCFCFQDSPRRAHSVAVVLVVFRCVDAALSGDAVGAARAVLEAKTLHVIAQFSQGRGGRSARESGADDDKVEFAFVSRVDQ